LVKVKEVLWKN